MLYRRLGRTELFVSVLGFGAHTDPRFKRPARDAGNELTEEGQMRRDRMVSRALDLGVNLLDVYSYEAQYPPVAKMIERRRDRVLVSLKHDVGRNAARLTSAHLDSRARLFGGHVDMYRIARHDPFDGQFFETWDALRKAKQAGKIRATGIASHKHQRDAGRARAARRSGLHPLPLQFHPRPRGLRRVPARGHPEGEPA
jgi:aryl-alcohol dehydrogenase-like predicted oxidoreductase